MNPPVARPRPIFGALVLVAIGVVWLLVSFRVIPSPNVWVLVQFWPMALIVAGLELLLRPRWPAIGNVLALAAVTLAVVVLIFARQLGLSASSRAWFTTMPFMWGDEAGSGPVISQDRAISGVDSVTFTSFGELVIQQGAAEALTIEAQANVLPEIITEVQDGTLVIRYAERNGQARVRPTDAIRLTLTVTDLSQITLSGAGDVHLQDLQADHLQAIVSGAGSLAAVGAVQDLNLVLSGVGSFQGADLQSQTATVTLSGVGNAVVWATQRLNVTISGVGWVDYYGHPTVNKDGGGLGNVRALGDK